MDKEELTRKAKCYLKLSVGVCVATSVWAATLSVKEGKGGLYLDQISKQINNTGEIIKQMFCFMDDANADQL
jgi:hypothetical protein